MLARRSRTLLVASALLVTAFTFAVPTADARKPNEYDKIVNHLKSKYQAKKVSIPFLWLAKMAVKVVRPAGVKSFSLTLFEDLKFSKETVDAEMQSVLRQSFGPEWSSIFRVRSHDGQQAYMYIRESGSNVKLTLVTIEKNQAAVVRVTFSPEKLAEFINNPKIFGISLREGDKPKQIEEAKENPPPPPPDKN